MALIKCTECGTEISDSAMTCPKCGAPATKQTSCNVGIDRTDKDDPMDVGMKILSFLVPIAGLILFFIWKDEAPQKAKECGKLALWGFVTEAVLGFLYLAIWPLIFVSAFI